MDIKTLGGIFTSAEQGDAYMTDPSKDAPHKQATHLKVYLNYVEVEVSLEDINYVLARFIPSYYVKTLGLL